MGVEVVEFHSHLLLHKNAWLFKHVHKVHHEWPAPAALQSHYVHWLEFLMINFPITVTGVLLCGSHMYLAMSLAFFGPSNGGLVHSGYFFFSNDLGFHDLHHKNAAVNFGGIGLFDLVYGTLKFDRKMIQAMDHKGGMLMAWHHLLHDN